MFGDPAVGLLAHQGGWDEAVLVAVPLAVFACLLWLASRRAAQAQGKGKSEPKD